MLASRIEEDKRLIGENRQLISQLQDRINRRQAWLLQTSAQRAALTASGIETQIKPLRERGDLPGAGSALLETLLLLDGEPVADIRAVLESEARKCVARRFYSPEDLQYGIPLRDEFLPLHLHGDWQADSSHQLFIIAFLLGATRRILPVPHDELVDFYTLMSQKQSHVIVHAVNAYLSVPPPYQPPPPPPPATPPPDFTAQIKMWTALGMNAEAIAEEIRREMAAWQAGQVVHAHLSQASFHKL